jgi:hypothetical protein
MVNRPSFLGWRHVIDTGDFFAHDRIGLQVLHAVIVHDAEIALAESFGHGAWHFGLGFHDACSHLLLQGDGHGAALIGLGLGDLLCRH